MSSTKPEEEDDKLYTWGVAALHLIHASFCIFKALEDNCSLLLQDNPKCLSRSLRDSGTFCHIFVGENLRIWHDAFQLGAYESLNYFDHLQTLQGMPLPASAAHSVFTGLGRGIKKMRQTCAASRIVERSSQPESEAKYLDRSAPFSVSQSMPIFWEDAPAILSHYVSQSIHPPVFGLYNDVLKWTVQTSSRLLHSPTFRTAFAKRRRQLELKTNASNSELIELAVIYRFQKQLDFQDRLLGKAPPIPLSGSPDFSISNSSSIAVYPRMDRSLVLGFTSVVDSVQLNVPDGKQLLWKASEVAVKKAEAGSVPASTAVAADRSSTPVVSDVEKELEQLRELPPALPFPLASDKTKLIMKNISESAKKITQKKRRENGSAAATSSQVTHPILMQRLAEASSILPLHGPLPQKLLNCYEVSLLNVNVHSKVATMISDKRLSQTLLSDPNQKSQDVTAETLRQKEFSESMLSIMHEHPKSAHDVRAYRHSYAARRSLRVIFNHGVLLILVIALALIAASGPEVSALVQYIRKQISGSSIPSLTPMSDWQSNVNKQLAPLLWSHCDTNPSSCGMSRLGSVRVTQWRRSSLADAPCFSSSQFTQSCMGSDIAIPGAASQATLSYNHGNVAIGKNGEIVILLSSNSADERLWDDLFKPDSSFFTAETSKIQVEATLFSPKLQHFVSIQIIALLESGLAQYR